MDRGAWCPTVHGITELDTTARLSMHIASHPFLSSAFHMITLVTIGSGPASAPQVAAWCCLNLCKDVSEGGSQLFSLSSSLLCAETWGMG